MKKLHIFLVLFPFIIVARMNAQDINLFGRAKNSFHPSMDIYGEHPFRDSSLVFTHYAYLKEGWAEGLVGLGYYPKEWLEIFGSIGFETESTLLRGYAGFWIGNGNHSFLALLEKGVGGDNYLYAIEYEYFVSNFTIGANAWRYFGVGPVLGYYIKPKIKPWIMPAYDFEFKEFNMIVGVKFEL